MTDKNRPTCHRCGEPLVWFYGEWEHPCAERDATAENMALDEIHLQVKRLIRLVGDDPDREGLEGTPDRVARAWAERCSGYGVDPASALKWFSSDYPGWIQVNDISFSSTCEHHLLPFWGVVSIGYQPSGEVIGVSKLSRLVDVISHRLQIQENLTQQIVDTIAARPSVTAVEVTVTSEHSCMKMRGVRQDAAMETTLRWERERGYVR